MTADLLFRILAYIWLAFGAYWMGFSLARKNQAHHSERSSGRVLRIGFLAVTFIVLFWGRHRIPALALIILSLAWAMLGIYWATAGKSTSSTGEFPFYRLLRLTVLAVTFSLLFWRGAAIGFLADRFVPANQIVAVVGFLLALLGMATASWARLSLGHFWSDKVVIQSGHELIRIGPYARMRHPIYSGILLGVLGTAVLLGECRGLLAFTLLLVNYIIKARKEERLLSDQFGPGFNEHAAQTGFLLPRLRPASR